MPLRARAGSRVSIASEASSVRRPGQAGELGQGLVVGRLGRQDQPGVSVRSVEQDRIAAAQLRNGAVDGAQNGGIGGGLDRNGV